jgi:NTE family protein
LKRGLALGCGGTLGAAWTVGVLAGLVEAGWDPREADAIIGTSAGAEYGAMLAAGVPVSDMVAAHEGSDAAPLWLRDHLAAAPRPRPPVPSPVPPAPRLAIRRGLPRLTRLAGLLPTGRDSHQRMLRLGEHLAGDSGWVDHPAFFAVVVDLGSGARITFGAPDAPEAGLGQAIAASWAVPACYPPVEIGGRRHIDGGAASTVSLDLLGKLAPDLEEIIVVAPMASSPVPRPKNPAMALEARVRRLMSDGLATECAEVTASGITVRRFEMDASDLEVAGPNFNDRRRRRRVFEHSLARHRASGTRRTSESGQ